MYEQKYFKENKIIIISCILKIKEREREEVEKIREEQTYRNWNARLAGAIQEEVGFSGKKKNMVGPSCP